MKDAQRHIYLTGRTGSGKSSRIEQRIYWQRYASRKKEDICLILLDPHGDSVEKLRKCDLAKKYHRRLMYIDPVLRKDFTPCMNPFEYDDISIHSVDLYTQQLVQVFQELIPDAKLSNYMRALLKPCIATLLQLKTSNLKDLQDFMSETKYVPFLAVGKQSMISAHRMFFYEEFESSIYRMTKGSIYTKIQSLLNAQTFYHMVTGKSTINLEQATRQGKIILFNLSKGKLGQEVSETL